jgi:hypothetical protein
MQIHWDLIHNIHAEDDTSNAYPGHEEITIPEVIRESVHCDLVQQECAMKPVISLVDNAFAGSISGEIDPGSVEVNNPACSGGNVVYVYKGHDVIPDDVHKAAFLHEGDYDYTEAFTCHAIDDYPETHETIDFAAPANVSFAAGHEARHDFK